MKKNNKTVAHQTIELSREFSCEVNQLFDAYADIIKRIKWMVPKGEKAEFSQAEFKVNGVEVSRCGDPETMPYNLYTQYLEIKDNQRIVFSETISYEGKRISISLNSMEFLESEKGTTLSVVIQAAALDGAPTFEGYRSGWSHVLENLDEFIEN